MTFLGFIAFIATSVASTPAFIAVTAFGAAVAFLITGYNLRRDEDDTFDN